MAYVFTLAAVLVVIGGLLYRRRLAELRGPLVDDDVIRTIEASGRVEIDDPLDLDEIREEEERFWGESWDEPEPL